MCRHGQFERNQYSTESEHDDLLADWFFSCGPSAIKPDIHNLTRFSRDALVTTETELNAIAAPAMIGDSNKPNVG